MRHFSSAVALLIAGALGGCVSTHDLCVHEPALHSAASSVVCRFGTEHSGKWLYCSAIPISRTHLLTCFHSVPSWWFGEFTADGTTMSISSFLVGSARVGCEPARPFRLARHGAGRGGSGDWLVLSSEDGSITPASVAPARCSFNADVPVASIVYLAGFPELAQHGGADGPGLSVFRGKVVEANPGSLLVRLTDSLGRSPWMADNASAVFGGLSGGAVFVVDEDGPIVVGMCRAVSQRLWMGVAYTDTVVHVVRPPIDAIPDQSRRDEGMRVGVGSP